TPVGSWVKTDGAGHGDDHFFPGPCDIAWDMAGAIVEWQMSPSAADFFCRAYQQLSGDDARSRLPAYLLAYSMFRLGFCRMAEAALGAGEEAAGFRRASLRYEHVARRQLRTSLTEPPIKLAGVETEEATAAGGTSKWVRVRREFAADSPFVSVQYSVSVDQKNIVETLVFRSREAKDVIQISLEDSVSASSDPLQVLKVDTPVDRVRIERFGKSSVVLTRCPSADQKTYQPLFDQGSSVLAHYRGILGVQQIVPADLKRLGVGASAKAAGKR